MNPAPIETRMMRSIEEQRVAAMDDPNITVEQTYRAASARIPLGRYGHPEEVARLMLFLGSDDSSLLHGRRVHGGRGQVRRRSVGLFR